MENTNATPADSTPGGVTQSADNAKASVAIGVMMVETVTHQKEVTELADKIMDVLEKEFGDPTLTTFAALFNIAMNQAGEFLTPELVAMAQALD
jgi:hypothetical protein